jgi:hypothetical protein
MSISVSVYTRHELLISKADILIVSEDICLRMNPEEEEASQT